MSAVQQIRRGDVFIAELPGAIGVEQDKTRPVVIVTNNTANELGGLVTVVPMTAQAKKELPTHVTIKTPAGKINIVLCEQIRSIDKLRLHDYKYTVDPAYMADIDRALKVQLGMRDNLGTERESLEVRMNKAEFICMLADSMEYADRRIFYDCAMELIIGERVLDRRAPAYQQRIEETSDDADVPEAAETTEEDAEPSGTQSEPAGSASDLRAPAETPPVNPQEPPVSKSLNPLSRFKTKPDDGYYMADIARLLEQPQNKIWYIIKKLNLKTEQSGHMDVETNRFIYNETAVTEIMNYLNKQ